MSARVCLLVLFLGMFAAAATPGIFQGEIVAAPQGTDHGGWIYVASPRNMLRRVEISRARVVYSEEVPEEQRGTEAALALGPGVQVIVTAHQREDGSWRATEVEILRLPRRPARKAHAARNRT